MRQFIRPTLSVLATAVLLAVISVPVHAQSGSRSYPPSGSSGRASSPAGSGLRTQSKASLALEGYCPVSLKTMNKWVKGSPSIQSVFDGHIYYFANAQGKQMFLADPKTYASADLAYGGNCVVCNVNMRQTVAGKPEFTVLHKGLRYLFPSAAQRDEFLANPEKYAVASNAAPASSGGSSRRRSVGSGSSTR